MSYEIYTPDLSNRKEISHAIAIKTSVKYNGVGKFTMILPIDEYNISAIKNNAMVLDKTTWETFLIRQYKIDTVNGYISAYGFTANCRLDDRAILEKKTFKTAEKDVYDFINANLRGLPYFETAPVSGLPDKVDAEILDGQLGDKTFYVLDKAGLGNKMVWNHKQKKHIFTIYKGRDLTQGIHSVIFSYERGTARNLVISDDISLLKTTFYISGELRDGRRIIESVGSEYQGADRLEKWIRDVPNQDDKTSEQQFRAELRDLARQKMKDNIRRQNFSVEIDPTEFGKIYRLGDIVSCVSSDFGVQFKARITGMDYSLDANGEKTSLILGEPNVTIIDEVKINGN